MIFRYFLICIFIVFTATNLQSQNIGFRFSNFVSNARSNHLGLALLFEKPLNNNALQVCLEMRSIDWGNAFNLGLGYKSNFKQTEKWSFGSYSNAFVGVAPFKQKSFMSYALAYGPFLHWQSNKRFFLQASAIVRYSFCPGYSDYGKNRVFEIPISISSGFNLSKKD